MTNELKPEPFERFCPLINKDCIGERCASYSFFKEEYFVMDGSRETKIQKEISGKRPKSLETVYSILVVHLCAKRYHLRCYCSQFKHLREEKTLEEEIDKVHVEHNAGRYTINPLNCIRSENFDYKERKIIV